jgi:hypothetical protein
MRRHTLLPDAKQLPRFGIGQYRIDPALRAYDAQAVLRRSRSYSERFSSRVRCSPGARSSGTAVSSSSRSS